MNIVLDTCLLIRKEPSQSLVPGFRYDHLDSLLSDKQNRSFIAPFSIPELWGIKDYANYGDLIVDLAKQSVGILEYDFSKLRADFSMYSVKDRYPAVMIYHLTTFLEFFVLEVLLPLGLDNLCSLSEIMGLSKMLCK